MVLEEHAKFVSELSESSFPTSLTTLESLYQKKMEEFLSEENCLKMTMVNDLNHELHV